MSSASKKQGIEWIRMALALFIITALVAVILSVAHYLTAPLTARSAEKRLQETLSALMKEAAAFKEAEGFEPLITTGDVQIPVAAVYAAEDSAGQALGYCVEVTPNGYAGAIDMMVAVDAEGAVSGVELLAFAETPGIGTQVQNDEDFRQSVYGLTDPVKIVKSKSAGKGEIQAISGATVSSAAYINGVNAALEVVQRLEQEVRE